MGFISIRKNKVFNNAMWIIVCKVIQSLLAFAINIITARYLGPSNFGLISYAASITAFVVPVMRLGIDAILVQEIVNSPENEGRILGSALIINFVMSIVCIVGLLTFTMVIYRNESETIIVCLLYSILLVFQAIDIIQYWFQAKLLSKYSSIISLFAYISVSLYKIYILIDSKNIYWFAISNVIDYCIIACLLIAVYFRVGEKKIEITGYYIKRLISRGRYFIVANLMMNIYAQADRIMLKTMMGNEETGYYAVAVSWATATGFIFTAIIDSMRPVIFESKKNCNELFEKNVVRLYSIIIYFSLAQCCIITFSSEWLIELFYGQEYLSAAATLQILVWYTTFSYIGSIRNIWIIAEDKQSIIWIINLFGVVMNLVLNYVLIPIHGSVGAAMASLITQILTNVFLGFILKPIRHNNKLMFKGINPKPIFDMIKR